MFFGHVIPGDLIGKDCVFNDNLKLNASQSFQQETMRSDFSEIYLKLSFLVAAQVKQGPVP
jgi:hypothetical protein